MGGLSIPQVTKRSSSSAGRKRGAQTRPAWYPRWYQGRYQWYRVWYQWYQVWYQWYQVWYHDRYQVWYQTSWYHDWYQDRQTSLQG
jgi:hypothetical protein